MAEFKTFNGTAVSWADITLSVALTGGPVVLDIDIVDLSWNSTRSRGVQMRGGRKFARTRGSTEHTASMTVYRSGWRSLVRELINLAQTLGHVYGGIVNYGDVQFNILAQWTPIGTDEIKVLEIRGCVIDDVGESLSEGDDADQVALTLNPMQIVEIIDGVEVALG